VPSWSRHGFQISPGEKFILIEDVVTRGERVQETIDIVHAHGGIVSAVGVIVDRSGKTKPDFGCPFVSLIERVLRLSRQTISRQISPKFRPSNRVANSGCLCVVGVASRKGGFQSAPRKRRTSRLR
jgi:hypothetical protein